MMERFSYTAIDSAGRSCQGTLEAADKHRVVTELAAKGLSAVSVTSGQLNAVASAGRSHSDNAKNKKVPRQFSEDFCRELSSLLTAGISISRALAILSGQSGRSGAAVLAGINADVVGGMSLADAMSRWPKAFTSVQCAMVSAGETGGFLDVVLKQIADFQASQSELNGRIQSAMAYPLVLAGVAVSVVIFMLSYFIPKFSQMFTSLGGELPALTRGIMTFSELVINHGLAVLGLLAVSVIIARRLLKTESAKFKYQSAMLDLPVVGNIISHLAMVRFCRMLAALIASGVPLVNSLRVAQKALGNLVLENMAAKAIDDVVAGRSLSSSLRAESRLFPASAIEMIAVSEQAGRLDEELLRLADVYQGKLDRKLRLAVSLAEPIMLFVMAALVATIFIGMLLPMLNIQDLIQ